MAARDAIDTMLDAPVGWKFQLRGRVYTKAGGCVSHYADRSTFQVWNLANKIVTITVRPASRIVPL